jgi:hypothetical protein
MGPEETINPPGKRTGGTSSSGGEVPRAQLGVQEPDDRLESWKEVAGFLKKGVRTVMRWEDLGMPVHRVPGAKRGGIVASRTEITQWLRGRPDLQPLDTPRSPILPSPVVDAGDVRPAWRKTLYLAGALGCSVVLLVAISILKRPAPLPVPARVHFLADSMQVLGTDGRLLWTHQFDGPLDAGVLPPHLTLDNLVRIGDLLGDGRYEVVVVAPVRTSPNPQQSPRFEVDCFSASGSLLWSYVAHETLRFGDREFFGPWQPYDIQVSRRGPPHPVLVAYNHRSWGYSFVTEIDPASGRGTIRFVNSGSIHRIDEKSMSGTTYLLVGGFNNEFDGGSLAIVNETRPFSASPQTPGTHHECASCPKGNPDYYLVFPRSEINRLRQVYETPVWGLNFNGNQFEVDKMELFPNGEVSTHYLFQTEPILRLLSLRFDSRYEMLHRELEHSGELDHPLSKCPERLHPAPVRVWTPTDGWKEWDVKPVAP